MGFQKRPNGPEQKNWVKMQSYLEFEKPVADIQAKVQELKSLAQSGEAVEIEDEVKRLQDKAEDTLLEIYGKLTPWQKTQVARHPLRPHFVDYIKTLITDFVPLAGDRKFSEDAAIQAGFGRFEGQAVAIIGQEKGATTEARLKHNFGSARPEGYRKAVRIMDMADRFDIPVIFFVDTAGAYPGVGAEERGQAEAIARSTEMCLEIGVPSIAIVIGEGGSGGAIAIATANKVVMLEHSIYTVASPEAAASILWRDAAKAQDAANNMKITAQDLLEFNIIDQIIPEPAGGAHRHQSEIMQGAHKVIADFLKEFEEKGRLEVREHRREKYINMSADLT